MSDFGTNILPGDLGAVNYATQKIIDAGDMSGDIASSGYDIRQFSGISMTIQFGAGATGEFFIQATDVPDPATGDWTSIPLVDSAGAALTLTTSGSAGSYQVNLSTLKCASVRLIYDFTSGTGTANAWMTVKGV